MRSRTSAVVAVFAALAGCSSESGSGSAGEFELPEGEAEQYRSAYLSKVVAGPEGEDLAEGGGEFVLLSNNASIRTDLGGWYVEDADRNRLPLGIGTQVDEGAQLRLYSACGENTAEKIFACADAEVLDDLGDTLTLYDSAGGEVAQFAYGDAAE
jgi:hypothetical protein